MRESGIAALALLATSTPLASSHAQTCAALANFGPGHVGEPLTLNAKLSIDVRQKVNAIRICGRRVPYLIVPGSQAARAWRRIQKQMLDTSTHPNGEVYLDVHGISAPVSGTVACPSQIKRCGLRVSQIRHLVMPQL